MELGRASSQPFSIGMTVLRGMFTASCPTTAITEDTSYFFPWKLPHWVVAFSAHAERRG